MTVKEILVIFFLIKRLKKRLLEKIQVIVRSCVVAQNSVACSKMKCEYLEENFSWDSFQAREQESFHFTSKGHHLAV